MEYIFEEWYNENLNALKELYFILLLISKYHGITLIENQYTINNFLKMMYYESSKDIITFEKFPEYF
jgi:hypothetical protein